MVLTYMQLLFDKKKYPKGVTVLSIFQFWLAHLSFIGGLVENPQTGIENSADHDQANGCADLHWSALVIELKELSFPPQN